jgi:hypothetical protein
VRDLIPKEKMGPTKILQVLKEHGCFPNATIVVAYRVLLTIPVHVASGK